MLDLNAPIKPALLIRLALLSSLTGLAAFAALLLVPHSADRAGWLGYSPQRLALIGLLLASSLAFSGLAAAIRQRPALASRIASRILEPWSFLAVACSLGVLLLAVGLSLAHLPGAWQAYAVRLRPALLYAAWVTGLLVWLQIHTAPALPGACRQALQRTWEGVSTRLGRAAEQSSAWAAQPGRLLALSLALSAGVIFQNALRYSLPVGYAGMYVLMAESIDADGFALPLRIPYYGPGGVPFAYPPLSFYLMAIVTRLTGLPALQYVRFAAPLFTLLAVAALYLLARELSGSAPAGAAAALFLAANPRIYMVHGLAAGMTRGLALFFTLLGLTFTARALKRQGWKDPLLAGACLGGSLLTHPSYVVLFAVSLAALTLFGAGVGSRRLGQRILVAAVIAAAALIISAPWLITVIGRYGLGILLQPATSLSMPESSTLLFHPAQLAGALAELIRLLLKTPLMAGAAFLGLAYFIARGDFWLPGWLILVALSNPRYDIPLIPVAAVLAGAFLAEVARQVAHLRSPSHLSGAAFLGLVLGCALVAGALENRAWTPQIAPAGQATGVWFQAHTPPESVFLLVPDSADEAEWFPYLLKRTPAYSSWGSEWTPNYHQQLGQVMDMLECHRLQSLACIRVVTQGMTFQPQYWITHTAQIQLNQALQEDPGFQRVYANASYTVWQAVSLASR